MCLASVMKWETWRRRSTDVNGKKSIGESCGSISHGILEWGHLTEFFSPTNDLVSLFSSSPRGLLLLFFL